MQKISTEFRKGILFIRIKGRIDNDTLENNINNLVKYIGIKTLVLNTCNLKYFTYTDIKRIINYNNNILKKKTKLIICDNKIKKENFFFEEIPIINREIDAFSLI